MSAVYDIQVRNKLYEYEKSLNQYPISASRRREKVKMLRLFLQNLNRNIGQYPICNKKKLGQIILPNGNVFNSNLRQTTYMDESETQWSISFLPISANKVKIYRLIQTRFIDESIDTFFSLTERMNNLHAMII